MEEFEQELEDLLAESVQSARHREATAFDDLVDGNAKELVLFGAGNLGLHTLTSLRKIAIEPRCFVDNNQALWDKNLSGIPVLNPVEAAKLYGRTATFVVTIWYGEAIEAMPSRVAQLRKLGCSHVAPFPLFYWKFSDILLPRYMVDLPSRVHQQKDRVRAAFHLMADDRSRREYVAQLRFRLFGDFACLPEPVQGSIYFREDMFKLAKEETFVDCGAFDGDTLSLFLKITKNSFRSAIALEPDPGNFAKLEDRLSEMPREIRQRIALHQVATGESNSRVMMEVGYGVASRIGDGGQEVECVALDSLLHGVPVSFIKMDIEGSELSTLAGARNLIQKNTPILAISAYHRQSDLWEIPLFIRELNPDYSVYLRPHLLEGWDLVCYAIPSNRLL